METARTPSTVTACQLAQQSTEEPKLLKGHRRRTVGGGRWVAAQKPPQQHLAGETSLLGATRSPTAVARAPMTSKRDGHNQLETLVKPALSISSRAKVLSQPRSTARPGNGRSLAQWETFKMVRFWHLHFKSTAGARAVPILNRDSI